MKAFNIARHTPANFENDSYENHRNFIYAGLKQSTHARQAAEASTHLTCSQQINQTCITNISNVTISIERILAAAQARAAKTRRPGASTDTGDNPFAQFAFDTSPAIRKRPREPATATAPTLVQRRNDFKAREPCTTGGGLSQRGRFSDQHLLQRSDESTADWSLRRAMSQKVVTERGARKVAPHLQPKVWRTNHMKSTGSLRAHYLVDS